MPDNPDSPLQQALDLNAPDPETSMRIEIKNEQLAQIDLAPFKVYQRLVYLNLSMNKIQNIRG